MNRTPNKLYENDLIIKFPREFIKMGECLAMIGLDGWPIFDSPKIMINRMHWKASRLSYNLNCKQISCRRETDAENVLHTCDYHWCINPDHLYLGTISQNNFDRWQRNLGRDNHRESCLKYWNGNQGRKRKLIENKCILSGKFT